MQATLEILQNIAPDIFQILDDIAAAVPGASSRQTFTEARTADLQTRERDAWAPLSVAARPVQTGAVIAVLGILAKLRPVAATLNCLANSAGTHTV